MKNNNLEKGIKDIRKIALSFEEKQRVFERLSDYAKEPVKSPFAHVLFFTPRFQYALASVLLAIVVGVGTASAASTALPGDFLYPVKIHINEPVQGFLKITPEAKIEWEGEKTLKRLDEADDLIKKGALNKEKQDHIEKEVEKNVDAFIIRTSDDRAKEDFEEKIEKRIDRIQDKGNDSFDDLEDKVKNKLHNENIRRSPRSHEKQQIEID